LEKKKRGNQTAFLTLIWFSQWVSSPGLVLLDTCALSYSSLNQSCQNKILQNLVNWYPVLFNSTQFGLTLYDEHPNWGWNWGWNWDYSVKLGIKHRVTLRITLLLKNYFFKG
jgi:hypothetical protein